MDGDKAPIEHLTELKRMHPNVMLYVDEAHAFGVLGPKGLGVAAGASAPQEIDVIVGTFRQSRRLDGRIRSDKPRHARLSCKHRPQFHLLNRPATDKCCLDPFHPRPTDCQRQPPRTSRTPWCAAPRHLGQSIPTYLLRLHTYSRSSWATPKKPLNFRASSYHVTA